MKKYLSIILVLSAIFPGLSSNAQELAKIIDQKEAKDHLTYISSDQMMGRDTGSPEIDEAAEYIISEWKKYGVKSLPDKKDFYQEVPLVQTNVPEYGNIELLDSTFEHGKKVLIAKGKDTTATLPAVFVNYGSKEDLETIDVKGKLAVAIFGFPGMTNVREGFGDSREKRKMLAEKGALGIVELYNSPQLPWSMLTHYINRSAMVIGDKDESSLNYRILVYNDDNKYSTLIKEKGIHEIKIDVKGLTPHPILGKNIIGYIEGKDPELKDEYVILSAHYDHVGHNEAALDAEGEPVDSIFNGARDNGIGITGLLMAAKYFGKNTPKRSILFIGFTAEEKGLLGSEYYAEHPLVPLRQCVFNVNIDCAGYNDTTSATIFGMTRSTAASKFKKACQKYGLEAMEDPIPEQNIFERSDHFNFAKKGVPCVLYGPGVTAFDEEITKYYHQVNDHASTLDFHYLDKVYQAFVYATELIANDEKAPDWVEGDKYAEAAEKLYERNKE